MATIFGVSFCAAFFMGRLDFSSLNNVGFITVPIPFKFGFQSDMAAFIPLDILYYVSALETTGDLTAIALGLFLPIEVQTADEP